MSYMHYAQLTWDSKDISIVRSDGTPTVVTDNGCIRLTSSKTDLWKGTAVWSNSMLDISSDFSICFEMFFGCEDAVGADGMVFVLHNNPAGLNTIGDLGGGMGYGWLDQSIGVEFDTFDNSTWGDPDLAEDHVSISANGIIASQTKAGPVAFGTDPVNGADGNVEDCFSYSMCITWDATSHTMEISQNGTTLITHSEDFVNTVFGGVSVLYWGFTSSTGENANEQWVCPEGKIVPWECAINSCCSTFTVNTTPLTDLCIGQTVEIGTVDSSYTKYDWTTGETTQSITVDSVGTYEVVVLQDQGGYLCPGLATIDVNEVAEPTATISGDATLCGNDSTEISIALTGNAPWSITVQRDGANDEVHSNINTDPYTYYVSTSGAYTISEIYDATCTGTPNGSTATIIVNTSPTADITVTSPSCFGEDGSITFALNTNGPYNVVYNDGADKTLTDINNNHVVTLSNLSASLDISLVSVTDANGCPGSVGNAQTITVPTEVILNIDNIVQSTCGKYDGSITVSTIGGSLPYTYSVDTGVVANYGSVNIFGDLSSGDYEITVTDSDGCTDSETANLTDEGAPVITGIPLTHVYCYGQSNGAIQIEATGGETPYTYTLTNISTSDQFDQPNNNIFTDLSIGEYEVRIKDNQDCNTSENIEITQPGELLIAPFDGEVLCFGDSTGVLICNHSGGTGDYNYLWSNGLTFKRLNNAPLGTYTVTVTDAHNCVDTESGIIVEPSQLLIDTLTSASPLCYGDNSGWIYLTAQGGVGDIRFELNGTEHTTDNNFIYNLYEGNYEVAAIDENDCDVTWSINIDLTAPEELIIDDVYIIHDDCNRAIGEIEVVVTGGISPFLYTWSKDNADDLPVLPGLQKGNYELTVTDDHGCTVNNQYSIINKPCPYEIPNVISPNGDEINDYFKVKYLEQYPNTTLEVYNRWGNHITSIKQYDRHNHWDARTFDGEVISDGVYFYMLKFNDGNVIRGDLTIIR